mmetsp:Transcript_9490/g.18951  ORF Transcript_9490/g.18951 Transcript_9490/m.18951 type:complete len:450 (+) Transcript_9490:1549-2898(+)
MPEPLSWQAAEPVSCAGAGGLTAHDPVRVSFDVVELADPLRAVLRTQNARVQLAHRNPGLAVGDAPVQEYLPNSAGLRETRFEIHLLGSSRLPHQIDRRECCRIRLRRGLGSIGESRLASDGTALFIDEVEVPFGVRDREDERDAFALLLVSRALADKVPRLGCFIALINAELRVGRQDSLGRFDHVHVDPAFVCLFDMEQGGKDGPEVIHVDLCTCELVEHDEDLNLDEPTTPFAIAALREERHIVHPRVGQQPVVHVLAAVHHHGVAAPNEGSRRDAVHVPRWRLARHRRRRRVRAALGDRVSLLRTRRSGCRPLTRAQAETRLDARPPWIRRGVAVPVLVLNIVLAHGRDGDALRARRARADADPSRLLRACHPRRGQQGLKFRRRLLGARAIRVEPLAGWLPPHGRGDSGDVLVGDAAVNEEDQGLRDGKGGGGLECVLGRVTEL